MYCNNNKCYPAFKVQTGFSRIIGLVNVLHDGRSHCICRFYTGINLKIMNFFSKLRSFNRQGLKFVLKRLSMAQLIMRASNMRHSDQFTRAFEQRSCRFIYFCFQCLVFVPWKINKVGLLPQPKRGHSLFLFAYKYYL